MDWTATAAVGQCVAAAVAVPTAIFVGFQVRAANKAADLTSLIKFHTDVTEAERRWISAESEDLWIFYFNEYLNVLEAYAGARRGGLLYRSSLVFVTDKLVESLAIIEDVPRAQQAWQKALSSPMALSELRRFSRRNRTAIDRARYFGARASNGVVDRVYWSK